jgi:hypothetical protein
MEINNRMDEKLKELNVMIPLHNPFSYRIVHNTWPVILLIPWPNICKFPNSPAIRQLHFFPDLNLMMLLLHCSCLILLNLISHIFYFRVFRINPVLMFIT